MRPISRFLMRNSFSTNGSGYDSTTLLAWFKNTPSNKPCNYISLHSPTSSPSSHFSSSSSSSSSSTHSKSSAAKLLTIKLLCVFVTTKFRFLGFLEEQMKNPGRAILGADKLSFSESSAQILSGLLIHPRTHPPKSLACFWFVWIQWDEIDEEKTNLETDFCK